MIRFLLGAAVLTCGAVAVFVEPPRAAEQARNLPMNFEVRREGPAETCGKDCRTWISAVGVITAETPKEFTKFAQGRDRELRGATIALDSEGGSVHGAMALGRAIRTLDMTTTVGRTVVLPSKDGKDQRARLLPRADCESMCAFVLLAGTKRHVPAQANVRVHQIWLGDRRDDATAANYSAEDLVLVQRDIGRLAKYTVEMDGSIDLLEMALRIPPWEPMRGLSNAELKRMGLSNTEEIQERGGSESVTTSAPSSTATSPNAARKISTAGHHRGWALVETAGRPNLQRQHPLTVEGEEIGSFDLTLACAETGEGYIATYAEQRAAGEDKALHKVTLTLGGRIMTLDVGASAVAEAGQLATTAAGVIPTALIKNLAEAGNRSVTVTTFAPSGKATTIRIGNSGLAQHYARLAGSCGKLRNAALTSTGKPADTSAAR